jgi:hypothetical protein
MASDEPGAVHSAQQNVSRMPSSRPFLLCSNSAGSSYFRRTPFASRLVEQQQSRSNQSGQSQLQRGLCRQLSCHCLLRRRFVGDLNPPPCSTNGARAYRLRLP